MKIKRIAIIGAGTAGWLAANHLGQELVAEQDVEITVIESPDVPSIGVGEGSVPYIMKGLKRFGISEAQLLTNCDATFKQGIKFVNWLANEESKDNFYYHPFDAPFPAGFDLTPYWLLGETSRPYDDVGIQARVCEAGLAPKQKSAREYEGELAYAYHFNAQKFAKMLAENAARRFGVKHKMATITDAELNEQGAVSKLIASNGDHFEVDFVIDCSGFSSVVIDKIMNVGFVSKADELLTDTVLVQQVPLKQDEAINPYTTATAHQAGWIWDIPLTNRRGTGFVYSSKHMSDEEALKNYAEYLSIDESEFSPRKIPMKVGYRETFWQKNCVALGLAQGFLEPIEATSILLSDFSAELLARNFPRNSDDIEANATYYNKVVTYAWERTVDFIKLHYCISDREDSQFWRDNKAQNQLSDELKQRLAKFKARSPHQSDFYSKFDLFDEKNFLYVLYGMKYPTRSVAISEHEKAHAQKILTSNDAVVEQAKQHLLPHKEWLMGLRAAMKKQST